jgi:hypothetical protein
MDTFNESHPVHSSDVYVAAQSAGTASLTDALARAVRIESDTAAAFTVTGDITDIGDRLRAVLLSGAHGVASLSHTLLEAYNNGWIAAAELDRRIARVSADLRSLAGQIYLAYQVGAIEVSAAQVAVLAETIAQTIEFRAVREAKAARKSARLVKAKAQATRRSAADLAFIADAR